MIRAALTMAIAGLALACQHKEPAAPRFEAVGPQCSQHQSELSALLQRLPERALPTSIAVELPESTIGEVPGNGALLELSDKMARFEGKELSGNAENDKARALAEALRAWLAALAPGARRELNVAAARDVDVQTLRVYLTRVASDVRVRLLVRMPQRNDEPKAEADSGEDAEARGVAEALLAERNPEARRALADRAFGRFSRCSGVAQAVANVRSLSAGQRWPALRAGLLAALPNCRCDELATSSLTHLLVAEQRAGAATLAALPAAFLRDERCGASMPLRSLDKLLQQMERFDAEFAGGFQRDELEFEKVLTDERLLNTFCNALPGETLAQLEKSRATLYWKPTGSEVCEGFRFEPLSKGAPMGTMRKVAPEGSALAFHYWQAAEEMRVYGPVSSPSSKPTDTGEWACEQNIKLTAVDAESLEFEHGHWFFDEASCRRAPAAKSTELGCVTRLNNSK